jgi:hypothetical protein
MSEGLVLFGAIFEVSTLLAENVSIKMCELNPIYSKLILHFPTSPSLCRLEVHIEMTQGCSRRGNYDP